MPYDKKSNHNSDSMKRSGPAAPQASGASIGMPRSQPPVSNPGSVTVARSTHGKTVMIRRRAQRGI